MRPVVNLSARLLLVSISKDDLASKDDLLQRLKAFGISKTHGTQAQKRGILWS